MDRFFKIKEQGSTVRTEIMAGITTFMTMAYILAVNPNILTAFGKTGMEWYPVFLATAIAAGIFTIAMGIFVNFPVALAPGMGLNAYFATVIVSTAGSDHPITWQMALTAVFISGIVFFLLTITHIRQKLLEAVPDALKHAITVGIGLFITIVGLKNSGLLSVSVEAVNDVPSGVFTPLQGFETVFGLGSFTDPNVLLTIIGLALISVLMILNVPGAILFGIIGTALIAIPMGLIDFSSLQGAQWVPDLTQMTVFEFDFAGIMGVGIVSIILTFTFVELFDTFGTLVGTANRAGFMKNREEGNKRVGKAMFVDSIAVGGGAVLGTSTVTAFVESSAGVAAGGRTGLTSVTTGICFLLALFLAPAIALIPGPATAAALIVVGVLMMQAVREINFNDLVIGIPAFMTITFMPFTYSIANGISFGILGYVLLAFVANVFGKGEQKYKIHWLMWILFVLVILRYVFMGGH
ncbi:NCS2 family permease [Paenibacillus thiaminolyticus]|uniref:NCS2 family permease n=1 Tax=Paenibacillus thiaminolyticus TaxID=49283 RepID=A0AAP9DWP3_PANTH|nr:NCS2 family permease [Paenibacillus thiaminolyticus]MCY9534656.1 NCS2 family permease [Paenibacillus thiaminolyticus]MCY9603306.1 NCS2 family permease [Paenibacillus thiaminolyticus]MCY9609978.1 NCS2 family permease [Paenibacillus thiaminolyticus]MCY9615494.1 NCS2 family permease [Paenibacillus thiaminolyticus]MCY9617159.1 NCS2 family permease [Paenibacillus thiaminolyticus]